MCGFLLPLQRKRITNENDSHRLDSRQHHGHNAAICRPHSILYGARDYERMHQSRFVAFVLIAAVTVVLNAAVFLLLDPIMALMQVPGDIYGLMREYLWAVCWGIGFTFLYNYYASLLRAVGDSVTPLIFLAVSVVLNIALDLVFILTFHWGVAGAAWATVLSQAVSAFTLLVYTYWRMPKLRLHRRLRLVSTFHAHLIHRIVRKHRVFIRVSVRVHQRRGAVRVVRQHLHQHRVRRRRRLDIRDFRKLDDHVVLRVRSGRRRRRSRRLVVVEPATRSRVAQFDGTAVDDARGNGETGKLLAVHFFESGFGFVAGAELDETVAFADGSAGLAHDLMIRVHAIEEYLGTAEREVFITEDRVELGIGDA